MAISGSGQHDSGIDRALQLALNAELDEILLSGELWPGERDEFPEPIAPGISRRPWQLAIGESFDPPGSRAPLTSLFGRRTGDPTPQDVDQPATKVRPDRPVDTVPPIDEAAYETVRKNRFPDPSDPKKAEKQAYLRWRRDRVGIVMVHGIGPQLAGQTLVDWTRPIITLLNDAAVADPGLQVPAPGAGSVTDPVVKSNIDFSGETFPVVQVRVPPRTGVEPGDPRGEERTWIFTETWWASEVRAPSLATMIGWLGEQGGVGRIVQGIQKNMLGETGPMAFLGKVSLLPLVSVITSFVLLVFLILLGLAKLIPFGPLRDAVVLRIASSFLTDWFGGARTILLDAAQSANVRHRLAMTVKALRAYGCRDVVLVAHSGGTIVSLTTLTDPAYPSLRVEKLITIGEALNLGWRLNDADPDRPPPTPYPGDRMGGDLGGVQQRLQWRDFWSTHDPAPSGPPELPTGFTSPPLPRFSAERVYNRMSIVDDHGGYWDNDEQFLIPLIREIDVPTGDRGASRFYSDANEDQVRQLRKERVSLLALWRRGLQSLPLLAIVAAATVSAPGFVAIAGDLAFQLFGLIPGNNVVADFFDSFVAFFNDISLVDVPLVPAFLETPSLGQSLYHLGTWTLEAILVIALLAVLVPARLDRLWGERPFARLTILSLELWIGIGVALSLVLAFFLVLDPADRQRIYESIRWEMLGLAVVAVGVFAAGWLGQRARKRLRRMRTDQLRAREGGETVRMGPRLGRDLLISVSALFLGALLIALIAVIIGVVLVIVDGSPEHIDTERFVVGAIVVLVAFRILGKLGTWRWSAWDVRERRLLRQQPDQVPDRDWPYILAAALTAIGFIATMIVALGADGSSWLGLDRDTWLVVLGATILVVIVICLGKDIVDNDITVASRPGGSGDAGEPGAISTPEPPKPAGA